jgi:hypothetical protein
MGAGGEKKVGNRSYQCSSDDEYKQSFENHGGGGMSLDLAIGWW